MTITENQRNYLREMMCAPTRDEADITSYFSSQHLMNGKELAGQIFSKVQFVASQLCPDIPIAIKLFPIKGNGMQVFVLTSPGGCGYECKVYAISKKHKICETLIDMFYKPEADLTNLLLEYSGHQGYADPLAELAPIVFEFATVN